MKPRKTLTLTSRGQMDASGQVKDITYDIPKQLANHALAEWKSLETGNEHKVKPA